MLKRTLLLCIAMWLLSSNIYAKGILEPAMVIINAGTFSMGKNSGSDEAPAHSVRLVSFKLSKYEITVAQFRQFADATRYITAKACYQNTRMHGFYSEETGAWNSPEFAANDNLPVVCVNWNDAKSYVAWLAKQTGKKYRLPSEAEWEYANRAGTITDYSFGDETDQLCNYANVYDQSTQKADVSKFGKGSGVAFRCDDKAARTVAVGSYSPNPFGLFDMDGNVVEWVEDCYHDSYIGAPVNNTPWAEEECQSRLWRGNSWASDRALHGGAAARHGRVDPLLRHATAGFRIAQDI